MGTREGDTDFYYLFKALPTTSQWIWQGVEENSRDAAFGERRRIQIRQLIDLVQVQGTRLLPQDELVRSCTRATKAPSRIQMGRTYITNNPFSRCVGVERTSCQNQRQTDCHLAPGVAGLLQLDRTRPLLEGNSRFPPPSSRCPGLFPHNPNQHRHRAGPWNQYLLPTVWRNSRVPDGK